MVTKLKEVDVVIVGLGWTGGILAKELSAALPEAEIIPFPIRTTELDAKHWWRSHEGMRRMVIEYCKYLVIKVRSSLFHPRPDPAAEAAPHGAAA